MPSAKNIAAIEELTDKLSRSTVAVATELTGVSVNTMTELRRHLRDNGIEYKVVKNSLVERSADALGKPEVKELLEGPTAIALGYGDSIEPIKLISEYIRSNRIQIVIRAAALEGRVFKGDDITRLAQIPSRETLAAQLVSQLAAPLSRLVNVLNNPLASFAVVLQQRVQQLESSSGE